jgi:hypothetical protein
VLAGRGELGRDLIGQSTCQCVEGEESARSGVGTLPARADAGRSRGASLEARASLAREGQSGSAVAARQIPTLDHARERAAAYAEDAGGLLPIATGGGKHTPYVLALDLLERAKR